MIEVHRSEKTSILQVVARHRRCDLRSSTSSIMIVLESICRVNDECFTSCSSVYDTTKYGRNTEPRITDKRDRIRSVFSMYTDTEVNGNVSACLRSFTHRVNLDLG